MYYLSKGLKERGFAWLGKIAAVLFAIFCIGGSFGGGNAAQSNQATIVIKEMFNWESTAAGAIVGIVLAILVGVIIIGGIKRIASVTEKVVLVEREGFVPAKFYHYSQHRVLVRDGFENVQCVS